MAGLKNEVATARRGLDTLRTSAADKMDRILNALCNGPAHCQSLPRNPGPSKQPIRGADADSLISADSLLPDLGCSNGLEGAPETVEAMTWPEGLFAGTG